MKIKLDENLPSSLSILLAGLGHDVRTVNQERLIGRADREIWDIAQKESRFLITQGMDFADLLRFVAGRHHGILLVRLHSPSRATLIARIGQVFRTEAVRDWVGCFVVVTEHKGRVRRPNVINAG